MPAKQKRHTTTKRPAPAAQQSLAEFMKAKLRTDCAVCHQPKEIRAQLGAEAVKRGFSRVNQVEWLRTACGANQVTLDILNTHLNQHHDREENFNAPE